ncbi:MAG: glycosyltransferase [Gammaproteobacteria bacterium]|nr:glycosyltransferase [Gammaproteobacteria bacterium]
MSEWPVEIELPALEAFFARKRSFLPDLSIGPAVPGSTPAGGFCALLDDVIRSRRTDAAFSDLLARIARMRTKKTDFDDFLSALVADGGNLTRHRTATGKRASLWGVTPIINLIPCVQADRLIGSDACSLVFNTYRISAGFDLVLAPQANWIALNAPSHLVTYRWMVFIWSMLRFDNFFLFNDQGIVIPVGGYGSDRFGINLTEMKLLKAAGKALYTMAYGADHRSRRKTLELGKYNFCAECPDIGRFCICDDTQAGQMLETISEYSTANLTSGLSTYYVPEAVNLNYLVVEAATYPIGAPSGKHEGPLRILHCPNHEHFKGTHYLREAVERLRNEGSALELRLLSGVSNAAVREAMLHADIVADQFLGGMFGYTAVEAMAMGRPVLCYLAHDDLVPDLSNCPIINASPDRIYEVLRDLLNRRDELSIIGERSRRYVEQQLDLEPFGQRLAALYRSTVPGYEAGLAAASTGSVVEAFKRWLGVDDTSGSRTGEVIGPPTVPDRLDWARALVKRYPLLRPFARFCWRRLCALRSLAGVVVRRCRAAGARLRRLTIQPRSLSGRFAGRNVLASIRRVGGRIAGQNVLGRIRRVGGRVAGQHVLARLRRVGGRVAGLVKGRLARVRRSVARTAQRVTRTVPQAFGSALVAGAVPIGRLATTLRMRLGRPRTLWGVTPIITLRLLSRCDRALGLDSESFVFTTYSVTSNFDVNLKQVTNWLIKRHPRLYRPYSQCVFAYALLRYDVFNYFFDRGVEAPLGRMGLNEGELQALQRAGKRLFVYTYGADVRTRERTEALGRYTFCTECPEVGRFCICDESAGRANTELVSRYATGMLAMGDMCVYVPGHRELHFWPLDLATIEYCGHRQRGDGVLRVAHATNQPWFKGTAHLVDAVEKLRAEGLPVELVSVSGLPNTEVLRVFSEVDLVAEQFLGGFHGYTALEAMAVGKPVISYIRDRERLAGPEECPIISATPEEIEAVLRDLLAGRYDLAELGRRGRRYVERYYAIDAVSRSLARVYLECGDFPPRVEATLRQAIAGLQEDGAPDDFGYVSSGQGDDRNAPARARQR